ncbi:hypothetical protein JCM14036_26700 [Desulfotomaculum defluvii]
MKYFGKYKPILILLVILLLLTVLGIELQRIKSAKENPSPNFSSYNAQTLYKYKTAYVGDNSKVIHLIDSLPYANLREEVSLQTQVVPYGVTVDYDFRTTTKEPQQMETIFQNNAVILFALIENVDEITFITKGTVQSPKYHYKRSELQKNFAQDLRNFSKDVPTLETLIKGLANPVSANLARNIDSAVSQAIIGQNKGYRAGEVATEGHIILDTEENNGRVKVYTIASFGWFEFENGVFTKTSGSGAIPTVITFVKNTKGEYSLLEYQEPEDGAYYTASIKKMFPLKLRTQVIAAQSAYSDLARQQEAQAAAYLKSIGRDAEVSEAHVEKKLADINVEASNKIFAELTKYDSFLNSCPYWLGTREHIEDGVRYIYETSQSKTKDGYDLIIFKKLKEDNTVVKEQKYKIVGIEVIPE